MPSLTHRFMQAVAVAVLSLSSQAFAAGVELGTEPPDSLIVTRKGLEWVWAGPCAGLAPSCGVVALHHGFGFATDSQWTTSFVSIADIASAFSGKCASPYFNTVWNHCDAGDITVGAIWQSPFAEPSHRNQPYSETFLVRTSNQVPEPAGLAFLGLGMLGLAAVRRTSRR